jgi:two-component system response regulator RegA
MSMRILVIDDDTAFAQVLARSLARRGTQTAVAHDTAAALDALVSFEPTHAVLDLKLGTENGLVTLRELLTRSPALRVLLLTGYASLATAVEAIKLGASNYLAKPVDALAVLAALGESSTTRAALAVDDSGPSLKRLEWEHIQRVLAECEGNVSAAARRLGLHRRTLQRKLGKRPVTDDRNATC